MSECQFCREADAFEDAPPCFLHAADVPVDPEPRATRLHERIANVLDIHVLLKALPNYALKAECACGFPLRWETDHHAHVASELERVVLEERQEWLREREKRMLDD